MKPVIKTRKSIKCSLCGKTIENGNLRFHVKDVAVNRIIDCHVNCMNTVHKLCFNCKEEKCLGFSECFKKSIKEISLDDIMKSIKFLFDGIYNVNGVKISDGKAILIGLDGSVVGEVNLFSIFGINSLIADKDFIHREWYNEEVRCE